MAILSIFRANFIVIWIYSSRSVYESEWCRTKAKQSKSNGLIQNRFRLCKVFKQAVFSMQIKSVHGPITGHVRVWMLGGCGVWTLGFVCMFIQKKGNFSLPLFHLYRCSLPLCAHYSYVCYSKYILNFRFTKAVSIHTMSVCMCMSSMSWAHSIGVCVFFIIDSLR